MSMNDMISRKDALNAVKSMYEVARDDEDALIRKWSTMSVLEHLPSANIPDINVGSNPGWISVKDRMPEEKKDILLQFKHNMVVGFWEDTLLGGGVSWYVNIGDGWITDCETEEDYDSPIAWMPLPEPYRPKEESKE